MLSVGKVLICYVCISFTINQVEPTTKCLLIKYIANKYGNLDMDLFLTSISLKKKSIMAIAYLFENKN